MSFATRHGLIPRRITGSAAELHGRPMGQGPLLELAEVIRPAVVLGSGQRDLLIDTEALHAAGEPDVTRRRGGGGAVWVAPGAGWWFDVTIPRTDPRWSDDVGLAFLWLGDALASWLAELGLDELGLDELGLDELGPVESGRGDRGRVAVHRGGLVSTPWSSSVCFAGLGPGEVTVDGRKLIGISQRRTREAARFMCWMPSTWTPDPLAGLVSDRPADDLADVGVGWLDLHGVPSNWSVGGDDDPVVRALVG